MCVTLAAGHSQNQNQKSYHNNEYGGALAGIQDVEYYSLNYIVLCLGRQDVEPLQVADDRLLTAGGVKSRRPPHRAGAGRGGAAVS